MFTTVVNQCEPWCNALPLPCKFNLTPNAAQCGPQAGAPSFGFEEQSELWATYYDIFVHNAFGNYRGVMKEVSASPVIGRYLTFTGNRSVQLCMLEVFRVQCELWWVEGHSYMCRLGAREHASFILF